jgi:small subunit ribosomal protein S7
MLKLKKAFFEIKLRQIEKWHAAESSKREEIETNPLNIFNGAIENCKPILKLVSVQKGSITYQVPIPIIEKESEFGAMKYIIDSCFEKPKDMRYYLRLANELLDAYRNEVSILLRPILSRILI